MRIYVSSTYMDLPDCGQKVNNAIRCLGHVDVAMEHYVAEPERPVDKCIADVTDCHSYLGVFLLGVMVTFPQNSYVHRLASALLHGCRTDSSTNEARQPCISAYVEAPTSLGTFR
jgi:hypothetical protein